MRLAILDRGHSLGTKVLFAIIRTISRQPIPEVAKLVMIGMTRRSPRRCPIWRGLTLERRCGRCSVCWES